MVTEPGPALPLAPFQVGVLPARNTSRKRFIPDPLHLVLEVSKVRNVVRPVAGVDTFLAPCRAFMECAPPCPAFPTSRLGLARVSEHPPAPALRGLA